MTGAISSASPNIYWLDMSATAGSSGYTSGIARTTGSPYCVACLNHDLVYGIMSWCSCVHLVKTVVRSGGVAFAPVVNGGFHGVRLGPSRISMYGTCAFMAIHRANSSFGVALL